VKATLEAMLLLRGGAGSHGSGSDSDSDPDPDDLVASGLVGTTLRPTNQGAPCEMKQTSSSRNRHMPIVCK
jgi:hypothetical protein